MPATFAFLKCRIHTILLQTVAKLNEVGERILVVRVDCEEP